MRIVCAFVVNNSLVIGQFAIETKSNELTAIPELLETLALGGALVSIDAMGYQHAIADEILEQGGDHLLAVKDNQTTLHAELRAELDARPAPTRSAHFFEHEGQGYDRLEPRNIGTESLDVCQQWSVVAMIMRVESLHTVDGKTSGKDRFFVCSHVMTAKEMAAAIRGH